MIDGKLSTQLILVYYIFMIIVLLDERHFVKFRGLWIAKIAIIYFFKMMFRWISYFMNSYMKLSLIPLKCWYSFTNIVLGKTLNNIVWKNFFVCCIDAPPPTWEQLENGLVAVRTVVHGLVDYIQNHSKKGTDQQQVREVFEI